jgi:hypothetical protein
LLSACAQSEEWEKQCKHDSFHRFLG